MTTLVKKVGDLSPDEWESALAGTLDLAKQKGYAPSRDITHSTLSMRCCALGSLQVAELCQAFDDGDTKEERSVTAISVGFDSKVLQRLNRWAVVGRNLAKIFVDGEG